MLLSVTTLHLASKYHQVVEEKVANMATKMSPGKVYQLGE